MWRAPETPLLFMLPEKLPVKLSSLSLPSRSAERPRSPGLQQCTIREVDAGDHEVLVPTSSKHHLTLQSRAQD